jgi:magnesium transporter
VAAEHWIDLLDPSREELAARLPSDVHASVVDALLAPPEHGDEPRPKLESHDTYVFGVFLVAVALPDEDAVVYQEVDVVLTRDGVLTVRKTPPGGHAPYDPGPARAACTEGETPAMVVYRLVDDIAERYLDLIDDLDAEADELEDHVEDWPAEKVRNRLSALRHDLLRIRRTLAPTRDAVREVVDNRIELAGEELFTRDVELSFGAAYDKLLRATEGLELSRDLVAGVRDYYQAKIAQDQNEVMKRLTVIASLLLLPTLIVGLYGQNFRNIPELHWGWGYYWSLGLIAVSTILQIAYYRWKKWI